MNPLHSIIRVTSSVQTTVARISCLLMVSGCATAWQSQGVFTRTAETQLNVESAPSGNVYLDKKLTGVSPVVLTLQYEQEVERKTRKVSYWQTQPGLTLLLTLASLGLYLPFSLIPVDTDTSLEPRDTYSHNHFEIAVEAIGYEQWKQDVVAVGEPTMHLQAQLSKAPTH